MRIGLISPYFWTVPGGVNNHVMSLVRHLERGGNEVYVIAPAGDLRRSQTSIPSNFICAGRSIPVPANGSVAHVSPDFFMLGKMNRILEPLHLDVVHVHEPTIPTVGAAATAGHFAWTWSRAMMRPRDRRAREAGGHAYG